MVMNQCALDRVMSRDEQEEKIQEIEEAKPGTRFQVNLIDEIRYSILQTLFFLTKTPYTLKIQGDQADWIKS